MGINAHILPGDWVATPVDGCVLDKRNPRSAFDSLEEDYWLLDESTQCLVIGIAAAGSNLGGHAFYVMTCSPVMFGWLWNYDVMPVVTQRAAKA